MRLEEVITEKRRGKLMIGVLLLQDNGRIHKNSVELAALHNVGFEISNHPFYNLDRSIDKSCTNPPQRIRGTQKAIANK